MPPGCFLQIARQAAGGIQPASDCERAKEVPVAPESPLQRVDGGLRRRQCGSCIDCDEGLFRLTHEVDRGADLAPRAVLQTPFLNLARLLGLGFFVFDLAAHQENEVGPYRALLGGEGAHFLGERFTRYRRFTRAQTLQFQHDHLLTERVTLAIGWKLETGKRDLTRTCDLDEERVGCGEAAWARTPVPGDGSIHDRIAGLQTQQPEIERSARLPGPRVLAGYRERQGAFHELELFTRAGDLRVAQLQRLQPEVVARHRGDRDRSPRGRHQEITSRALDPNCGRTIGRHDHGHETAVAFRSLTFERKIPTPFRSDLDAGRGGQPALSKSDGPSSASAERERDPAALDHFERTWIRQGLRGDAGVGWRPDSRDDVQWGERGDSRAIRVWRSTAQARNALRHPERDPRQHDCSDAQPEDVPANRDDGGNTCAFDN